MPPRLTLEWLNTQAASGYVEYDSGRFRLPEEQALALAVEDSPVFVAGGAIVLAALFLDKDKQVAAIRGDGAIPWGDHHPCLFSGTEKFFRPGYKANLVPSWLPALDGVVEKLPRRHESRRCRLRSWCVDGDHGAGIPQLALQRLRLPRALYHRARQRAVEGGVADRVTFNEAAAQDYEGAGFDLVCFFDCLHDMGDPVGAARHARDVMADDGTVLLVEPFAGDQLEDNFNPVGRMFYAASTFICTPNSLSQEVGRGLGAQAGEARLRDVFTEAGFTQFRRATETPFNLVLEARK